MTLNEQHDLPFPSQVIFIRKFFGYELGQKDKIDVEIHEKLKGQQHEK